MRETKYTQCKAIVGQNPTETAMLFNQAMIELREMHPTYERVDATTFFLYYTESEWKAESIAEEYEMAGCGSTCADCPYCERAKTRFGEIDKRTKIAKCRLTDKQIIITSGACDEFYINKERGDS